MTPQIICVGCGAPTGIHSPLCTACLTRGLAKEMPPCEGEALRDTLHAIQHRAADDLTLHTKHEE